MSNIAGVAGPSAAQVYSSGQTGVMLSPESLMFYCASQLRGLDGQINKRMAEQKSARDAQAKLGELQDRLAHLSMTGVASNDPATKAGVLQYYKEAYDKATSPEMKRRIEESFNAFRRSACYNDDANAWTSLATYDHKQLQKDLAVPTDKDNHNHTGTEELKLRLEEVKGIIADGNKGAELEMINLQSLISQRQMAVQLTTNLMSKINESAQAIIANTGK